MAVAPFPIGFPLRPDGTPVVIADIGKNFIETEDERSVDEYLRSAARLIDAAAAAGVDAVKFQTHSVDDEQLPLPIDAPHFRGHDRRAWVERNTRATPPAFWQAIKTHCDAKGILFFSTPMSRGAARILTQIDVPFWKVSSADVRDHVLLRYLLSTRKPIVISTGMVSLAELDAVIAYLRPSGVPLAVLYCVSKYPCPPEFFNLATIGLFQKKYPDLTIGFSDHSLGHDVALAAAKARARIIEKHFSFSRDAWGPDHKMSMTPPEMDAMVSALRRGTYRDVDVSPYYGQSDRELEGAGSDFRPVFYKSLVFGADLPAGTVLTEESVFAMRPHASARGLLSDQLETVLGRKIARSVQKYQPLTFDLLL